MPNHQTQCPGCKSKNIVDYLMAQDRFHGRTDLFRLIRCETCSLIWLAKPPKTEELSLHYSPYYDKSIAAAGDTAPERARNRKKTLTLYKQSGAILDLGCSAGSFLKAMDSKKWKLHGIEMSKESAKRAQRECGAEVFVGDILDAPFRASSFDAITCFHVFEHLYKPREVLSKVSAWLKPEGIFYVLVPNINSAGAHIFRSYWYGLEIPRHVFHYSPNSLSTMAKSVGLEVVSITTQREVFFEQSTRYIIDDLLGKIGLVRTPLAYAKPHSIPFRLIRKAFRLTILPFLTSLASFVGDGESIHAVFQKRFTKQPPAKAGGFDSAD